MDKCSRYLSMIPVYVLILSCLLITGFGGNKAVTVLSEQAPVHDCKTVIIDAGHGGEDGGATSYTGTLESQINLQIALRLDDLMHLLGIRTVMIRNSDFSVSTGGDSIAARKVSDLKERVRIINETEDAIMLSIHQNHFTDSRYRGAQVFYAPTKNSETIAKELQTALIQTVNTGSNRQIKKADGIYLMQHIKCPGVLVECGFLSNPTEEANLKSDTYQKKLCCVIACTISSFIFT